MKTFRLLFLSLLLLLASPLLQVARCQSESKDSVGDVIDASEEGGEVGIVRDSEYDHEGLDMGLTSAKEIDTLCVFPKNSAKVVLAGEETELLVGMKNDGDSSINVIAIKASVHLPFDHRMLVQNLTTMSFNKASVPASAQATFPYIFAVSKYLQPGAFDLVGAIIYEINDVPYQSIFYNGTIEVTESGGFVSVETVFLVTLAIGLLLLLGLWVYGQAQRLTKNTKKTTKVEVGTRSADASLDEWLQGTAYTNSLSTKPKKKKN